MESQPQNPEFRNNPENFHPAHFFSHIGPVSYPNILFLGWLLRSNLPVLIEQCSAEKFQNWGQCPTTFKKIGDISKNSGT